MKKKPGGRGPVQSVHERDLAEQRRSQANAPQTPGDEVQRPGRDGNSGLEIVIEGKDRLSEQDREAPEDLLTRLAKWPDSFAPTPELNKAIIDDPTISYEQVRDAINRGMEKWRRSSGIERE